MRTTAIRFTLGILLASTLGVLLDASAAFRGGGALISATPIAAARAWASVLLEPPRRPTVVASANLWFAVDTAAAAEQLGVVVTHKTGYLGGEVAQIGGSGFVPSDVVTLRVLHAGGGAEEGMGHDPFVAAVGEDGTFTAYWSIPREDLSGNAFVLTASGVESGATADVQFSRIATVETDKFDYLAGETAQITGTGFFPGESVIVRVEHSNGLNDGAGHEPYEVVADVEGNVSLAWYVNPDDSLGAIMRVRAIGQSSGLDATTTFRVNAT